MIGSKPREQHCSTCHVKHSVRVFGFSGVRHSVLLLLSNNKNDKKHKNQSPLAKITLKHILTWKHDYLLGTAIHTTNLKQYCLILPVMSSSSKSCFQVNNRVTKFIVFVMYALKVILRKLVAIGCIQIIKNQSFELKKTPMCK